MNDQNRLSIGLKQAPAKAILKKWTAGSSKLAINLLRGTLSVHKLEDIEWKFGVTAANSELEHVRPLSLAFARLCLCVWVFQTDRHVHVPASRQAQPSCSWNWYCVTALNGVVCTLNSVCHNSTSSCHRWRNCAAPWTTCRPPNSHCDHCVCVGPKERVSCTPFLLYHNLFSDSNYSKKLYFDSLQYHPVQVTALVPEYLCDKIVG